MLIYKIIGFAFLAAGFGLVYAAGAVVKKYRLDEKVVCSFENELDAEEVAKYKRDKAMVNLKMLGLLITIPGIALIVLAFR
jgi:hypothetical protein